MVENLPPAKLNKFENWIINSAEARREYVAFMDMSSSLVHYADEIVTDDDISDDEDSVSENKLVRFIRPIMGIAALLVFGLTIFNFPDSSLESKDSSQITDREVFDDTSSISIPEKLFSQFSLIATSVGMQMQS